MSRKGSNSTMQRVRSFVLGFGILGFSAACGGTDPSDNAGGASGGNPSGASGGASGGAASLGTLLPWKTGNNWAYRVTDDEGVITLKRTTVGEVELVGGSGPHAGKMANKVTTHKDDTGDGVELDETVSWQAVEGERVVRYREQAFNRTTKALDLEEHWDPPKLHIDSSAARTTAGAQWRETYAETKLEAGKEPVINPSVTDNWQAIRIESVTVPAGTFEAVVFFKANASNAMKTYWYVPGIGKVKETGNQTEELTEYDLK